MRKRMLSKEGTMTKEISDGIKALLGKHVRILLKCSVKLEKGEKTENRVLVYCPCRLFVLKLPPRIDFHFHYLEIQAIESKKPNQLVITANDKTYSFMIPDPEKVELIDKMMTTLLTAYCDTFPGIPLFNIVRRIDVVPASRLQHLDLTLDGCSNGSGESGILSTSSTSTPLPYPKSKSTSSLEESAMSSSSINVLNLSQGSSTTLPLSGDRCSTSSMNSSSAYHHGGTGPCGGFSTQYAWMCDLLGLPYREEVAWDVDTIYLSHDSRELSLHDFDHLEIRDLVPIISVLEYNTWFKSIKSTQVKLSHEAMDKLLQVVRKSLTIEELHLDNVGAKADFAQKLSAALQYNTNSQIHTLDMGMNDLQDKGAIHLSNPLAKLCKGPVWLNLSSCGLTAKGVSQLAHALTLNRCAPNTLTHLNLSGNSLKDDINNLCTFLAQPNSITFLDLSSTDCTLEMVFGALLRGCGTHLANLNLSRNNFATKKGKEIPPSFKQFLTSSLALNNLSLAQCKLSLEALKQLLLGLACNESTAELELDISTNALGQQGAHVLESCLHGIKCLASLDISDNNLEAELAGVVSACSKNKSLKHLNLGRNLQSTKTKHVAQVMDAIVHYLQEEDCVLQTLSLADSKLKGELYSVINALGSNQCLQNIDISGNLMGDVGGRLLSKALQINNKLKSITYDRNNITLQGFSDIAYGLESNMSVRYMPFPVNDVLPCMKVSGEKTEAVMKRIQDLIYRNSQPKKSCSGQQAFRLQQGFLLSSAQQTVDKLIAQTQDGVKLLKRNEQNNPSAESNYQDVISHAEGLIQDSEKAKQLLVSLHEMIDQKGESGKVIESKLMLLADELHSTLSQHIQNNIDNVLQMTAEKCPTLMTDASMKEDIKQGCIVKSAVGAEFVRHCVMDMAGTDIINKLGEVQLAVASHVSDKLVDKAIESLMKCQKQLSDVSKRRSSTPDVLKTRLRSPSETKSEVFDSSLLGDATDQSPMATPQMHAKRKGFHGRRIRPKSVVDCIEGLSADDIPDLLPSLPKTVEETISSLQVPSSHQLKHLGKARPKKPKTRAPTRPCLRPPTELIEEVSDLQEGLDTFFRPGSATPTPLVTPDSDECSTSLMISMASTVEDCSIQSTPTHSSRTFRADNDNNSDKTSPGSFDSCSISSKLSPLEVPRSKSSDCLEKPGLVKRETLQSSPGADDNSTASGGSNEGQRSPVAKIGVSMGSSVLAEMKARQEKRTSAFGSKSTSSELKEENVTVTHVNSTNVNSSPITTNANGNVSSISGGLSVSAAKEKFNNSNTSASNISRRPPPPLGPKPRPWSTVDRRSGEYSLGSDGSPPDDTPIDSSENVGKSASPDKTIEPASLPPATTNSSQSNHHSIFSNKSSLVNNVSSGAISISFGSNNSNSNHTNNRGSMITDNSIDNSPISLPSWGTEKRTVKELAASLARHHSHQEETSRLINKKGDSLPRNQSTPIDQQDFSRARVSIQEWSRHHENVWKVPLRKFSGDKPITKRWAPNEQNANVGRKLSMNEEDVVNV